MGHLEQGGQQAGQAGQLELGPGREAGHRERIQGPGHHVRQATPQRHDNLLHLQGGVLLQLSAALLNSLHTRTDICEASRA